MKPLKPLKRRDAGEYRPADGLEGQVWLFLPLIANVSYPKLPCAVAIVLLLLAYQCHVAMAFSETLSCNAGVMTRKKALNVGKTCSWLCFNSVKA